MVSNERGNEVSLRGTVKWFDTKRAFGFIADDKGGDVFVHITAVLGGDHLCPGDAVEFELERNRKTGRDQASRVRTDPLDEQIAHAHARLHEHCLNYTNAIDSGPDTWRERAALLRSDLETLLFAREFKGWLNHPTAPAAMKRVKELSR